MRALSILAARIMIAAPVAGTLLWVLALGVLSPTVTCARAAGAHHVAVVVQHGGGAVVTSCVSFDAADLSGDEVMQASGIQYATENFGGFGKAVCQVDHEPAAYPPGCWTATSNYWGMFVSQHGGPWAVSRYGISSQRFADGDALGWHYIPPNGSGGPPPSPAGVCTLAAPSPTPTVTPPPTLTPQPTPQVEQPPAQPSPAPETVVAATPASTPSTLVSPPLPSESPSGAVPGTSPRTATPDRNLPDLGWLAASLGVGSLLGLLAVRLLAQRLRR